MGVELMAKALLLELRGVTVTNAAAGELSVGASMVLVDDSGQVLPSPDSTGASVTADSSPHEVHAALVEAARGEAAAVGVTLAKKDVSVFFQIGRF